MLVPGADADDLGAVRRGQELGRVVLHRSGAEAQLPAGVAAEHVALAPRQKRAVVPPQGHGGDLGPVGRLQERRAEAVRPVPEPQLPVRVQPRDVALRRVRGLGLRQERGRERARGDGADCGAGRGGQRLQSGPQRHVRGQPQLPEAVVSGGVDQPRSCRDEKKGNARAHPPPHARTRTHTYAGTHTHDAGTRARAQAHRRTRTHTSVTTKIEV